VEGVGQWDFIPWHSIVKQVSENVLSPAGFDEATSQYYNLQVSLFSID
jgi:hypothetical protein